MIRFVADFFAATGRPSRRGVSRNSSLRISVMYDEPSPLPQGRE